MTYKEHPLYLLWRSVRKRTNPHDKTQERQPCYQGVTLHPQFQTFEGFRDWASGQIGSDRWPEFVLDKDLLSRTAKQYGPDTCVFIPDEINLCLGIRQRNNTSGFPGVTWCKQTELWAASIKIDKTKIMLGRFQTKQEAFDRYCIKKKECIQAKALKWRDHIDPRAYEALMQYDPENYFDQNCLILNQNRI